VWSRVRWPVANCAQQCSSYSQDAYAPFKIHSCQRFRDDPQFGRSRRGLHQHSDSVYYHDHDACNYDASTHVVDDHQHFVVDDDVDHPGGTGPNLFRSPTQACRVKELRGGWLDLQPR
jgi:hypothetical protein